MLWLNNVVVRFVRQPPTRSTETVPGRSDGLAVRRATDGRYVISMSYVIYY